ncbi:hypothetical protein CXB51_010048 [Gossypium anomalum]|uniref:Uncharacterized protein n=1 Tax=Gossypium anomalum TaxID=47600 RepID=A0A8J5Z075_9ROSI|nr:hypothetical protein CXB51_010048 [Gossypium anomalum]
MSKEEFEQTRAKRSVLLREMLSAVEEHVGKLKESMEDAKELHNALGERIDDLGEQSRDSVTMCLTYNRDNMQELLDSQRKKLTERNDALEAMVMVLNEETMATMKVLSIRIEELDGELALCRTAMRGGVLSAVLSYKDVPKSKEFVKTRSCFYCGKAGPQIKGKVRLGRGKSSNGTIREYVREFKELMLQVSDETEKEALLAFQNRLKLWVRQEVEQRGVQKLSEAMTVTEFVIKLGLRKDKLESSKSEEKGIHEKDHIKDYDGNGISDNSGNGKPRKSMLSKKEKSVGKALELGSSARSVKAKEAKS